MLNVLWEPVDTLVSLYHFLPLTIDIHEPTGVSTIHKLCAAAVAMRITVANVFYFPYYPAVVQGFGDLFIYFPDLLAFPLSGTIKTATINVRNYRKILFFCQVIIFFTVGWCQVYNTGPIFKSHIICMPNFVCIFTTIFKKRFVTPSD